MGAVHLPLAGVLQGATDAAKKAFRRAAPVKDFAGDVVAKTATRAEAAGVNRLPGGGDGVGLEGHAHAHPGVASSSLAEGGSEALAEFVGNGLFYGGWSTSWSTFTGASLSGVSSHGLHSGAVASGTWINSNFVVKTPPVMDGVMNTERARNRGGAGRPWCGWWCRGWCPDGV